MKLVIFMLLLMAARGEVVNRKQAFLQKIIKQNKLQVKKHEAKEGTGHFDIGFDTSPEPASVHTLRPQDISVIGALGDSITAANGAGAETMAGVIITYVGLSWSIGGDGNIEDTITLTNILRSFNPHLKGYSTGTKEDGFNAAVPGARAKHIPNQARDLVARMKNSTEIDFDNSWKIVTIFIGGNDLCDLTSNSSRPQNYIAKLEEGLDILHKELPRTLVNIVEILEIYLLPEVAKGYGSTVQCGIMQKIECPYVTKAEGSQVDYLKEQTWEYQKLTQELISSGKYDDRDDFTVVIQPFFRNTVLPYTENGEVDATYFAPDCFHFSAKGHAMGAINLWNNMLEPVGEKTTSWSIMNLKVPTEEHPYIFTSKNSFQTKKTTTCSTPEWLIAVLVVLAVGLLIEAIIVIAIGTNRRKIV